MQITQLPMAFRVCYLLRVLILLYPDRNIFLDLIARLWICKGISHFIYFNLRFSSLNELLLPLLQRLMLVG